jgi:hypothetical protein
MLSLEERAGSLWSLFCKGANPSDGVSVLMTWSLPRAPPRSVITVRLRAQWILGDTSFRTTHLLMS